MGRPLTGHLGQLPSGSWRASVPAARGSRRRLPARFPDKASARRWMATSIADLEAGRTPAAPDVTPDDDPGDADRYRPEAVYAHYHKQP